MQQTFALSRIASKISVNYVVAPVFTPADGAVGSFQNPADGAAGDVTVEVQSCEGLKNTAFTNTTRSMNLCFSHSTTELSYCRVCVQLLGLVEILCLHSLFLNI